MTDGGMLIVVSGPSGVGKDTVVQDYLRSESGCVLSVSATTRAARPGEREGIDYFFLRREEFLARIGSGGMLEYAEYNGNYYGTPRDAVDRSLAGGKNVILIIEVQGAAKVRELYPQAVLVFILPPSMEDLRGRLTGRATEDSASIECRMQTAREEIALAAGYDYILVNRDRDACAEELGLVIRAAALSPKHSPVRVKGVF